MRGGARASLLGTILRWAFRAGWPPWVFLISAFLLLPRTKVPIDPALRWLGDLLHRPVVWVASWNGASSTQVHAEGERSLASLRERAAALREVERERVKPNSNLLRDRQGVFADVLERGARRWWIGAGERQGVRVGDFATYRNQIVGRVTEVRVDRSELLTIESEELRIPVRIGEESGTDVDEEEPIHAVVHGRADGDPWSLTVSHPSRDLPDEPLEVEVSLGPAGYRGLLGSAEPEASQQLARVTGFRVGTLRSRLLLRRRFHVEPVHPLETICCVLVHAIGGARAPSSWSFDPEHLELHDPLDSEPGSHSLGLARGRSDGFTRGAPVVRAGRLLGEIATDAPWTARVAPFEESREPFPALWLEGEREVFCLPELVVLEREGELLWLSGAQGIRAGAEGHLYTAPREFRGWKGIYLGACVAMGDGRMALAFPRSSARVVSVPREG